MFDYHIVGEITVNHHSEDFYTDSNGQQHKSESDEKYLLTLNNQGNVVNINESDDYDETDTKAGYTEDGRLGKLWEDTDKNGYEWYEKFFYTDGLLTKAEIYESDYDTEVQEFKVDEFYLTVIRLPERILILMRFFLRSGWMILRQFYTK